MKLIKIPLKIEKSFFKNIFKISPNRRRFLIFIFDNFAIYLSLKFTSLFFQSISKKEIIINFGLLSILTLLISSTVYLLSKQYSSITRYIGSKSVFKIFSRNVLIYSILYILNINLKFIDNSPSVLLIYFCFSTFIISAYRFIIRDLIIFLNQEIHKNNKKAIIYGAGSAGIQLFSALKVSNNYTVLNFVDDDRCLWQRKIDDVVILPPSALKKLHKNKKIDIALLAIQNLSITDQKRIFDDLNRNNIRVLKIPTLKDLSEGKVNIDELRPIEIEDLLGRKKVTPKKDLLKRSVNNKTIFITGGAGSIGSELCMQILKYKPKKLIILDSSEFNIYSLSEKINNIYGQNNKIFIPILGDCNNEKLICQIFEKNKIEVVFHAAAFKHVPIIEKNPLVGLKNNVISTLIICNACQKYSIKNMTLISSDKAVRPTNIMGASKRVSELIVQSYASLSKKDFESKKYLFPTSFSIVRFGNVLNSSGSVVPLFKKQIKNRKHITITDPKIIRYFMTIREAAELIIQSTSLQKNGDILLLDMGEPIKIIDLAKKMINLSGLKLKDKNNPEGDIEIKIIGLRPGEKLYEELLIESNALNTEHPLIYRSREVYIKPDKLIPFISKLENNLNKLNKKESLKLLKKIVPEWNPMSK